MIVQHEIFLFYIRGLHIKSIHKKGIIVLYTSRIRRKYDCEGKIAHKWAV